MVINVVARYVSNGSIRFQSVQIPNGAFSAVVVKGTSSGSDMQAEPCNRMLTTSCGVDFGSETPFNCAFGATVTLNYHKNSSPNYGGYTFETFGKYDTVNGEQSSQGVAGVICGGDTNIPFELIVVGYYSPNLNAFDDGLEEVSENGQYYEDSIGDWKQFSDGAVVATASEVANLPSNVEFNGWLGDDSSSGVIVGSDGHYYDDEGNELFSNLPSGVIPVRVVLPESQTTGAIYEGSDGHYYDDDGYEVLEYLPSGVTPVSCPFDDVYQGSDGHYYDSNGTQTFTNLPSGVTLVSNPADDVYQGSDGYYYDDDGDRVLENLPSGVTIIGSDGNGHYIGSDGNTYDSHGNEVVGCNGVLLDYSNTVRLTIDCVDIFGNQQNLGADIQVGQSTLNLGNIISPFNLIKKINGISCRNMSNNVSCGNGQLKIRGLVVGAKISADIEIIDLDLVPGNFNICTCVFNVCKKYADIVVNDDMPLGVAQQNLSDIGYYCLSENLEFIWEGFDEIPQSSFPYCCPTLDNDTIISTPIGNEKFQSDIDLECVCDGLDRIVEKLDELNCICDKFDSLIDKFDLLINAIVDKECIVDVEPCSPVVTNPVNNITVTPSTVDNINQITVEPCSPVVTNPVNNITVTPSSCELDNSDLIDKLDDLFTTEIVDDGEVVKKDITDIIKDKQCENVFECIVEPVNMAYEGYGKYVDKDLLDEKLEHL